jgi:hypothetical protein
LEHLFLIFQRNTSSCVLNRKFNNMWNSFLNLIWFFNLFSFDFNFDASYRCVLDRFWN